MGWVRASQSLLLAAQRVDPVTLRGLGGGLLGILGVRGSLCWWPLLAFTEGRCLRGSGGMTAETRREPSANPLKRGANPRQTHTTRRELQNRRYFSLYMHLVAPVGPAVRRAGRCDAERPTKCGSKSLRECSVRVPLGVLRGSEGRHLDPLRAAVGGPLGVLGSEGTSTL